MRKLLLLTTALFLTLNLWAQSQASDIVYPINGDSAILNCQIHDIKDGNTVFFAKDGKELVMQAVAVKRNGEFANLKAVDQSGPVMANNANGGELTYKGFNYNDYAAMKKRAQGTQTAGFVLAVVGVVSVVGGYNMISNAGYNTTTEKFANEQKASTGALVMVLGVALTGTGIPLAIVGTAKSKRASVGMENCTPKETSLQMGITPNGIGLVMKF